MARATSVSARLLSSADTVGLPEIVECRTGRGILHLTCLYARIGRALRGKCRAHFDVRVTQRARLAASARACIASREAYRCTTRRGSRRSRCGRKQTRADAVGLSILIGDALLGILTGTGDTASARVARKRRARADEHRCA